MVVGDRSGSGSKARGFAKAGFTSARDLWIAAGVLGDCDTTSMTGISQRVVDLFCAAMCSEDAEASGICAHELTVDPGRAVELLGAPGVPMASRHAVVQLYGGVGALLVIACEELWREQHASDVPGDAAADRQLEMVRPHLVELLRRFHHVGAEDMDGLVEAIEREEGQPCREEASIARRRLHVTYAVAARDGTDAAHRAYVRALDRVMALKRGLVST